MTITQISALALPIITLTPFIVAKAMKLARTDNTVEVEHITMTGNTAKSCAETYSYEEIDVKINKSAEKAIIKSMGVA